MNQSAYRLIYETLLNEINSGKYSNGERLPSEAELCGVYKVSRITSKRALDLLAEQGYIKRFPGKGSYANGSVAEPEDKKIAAVKTIGLVIPDFTDSHGVKLIYGIEDACTSLGYQLVIKRTRNQAKEEEEAIRSLSYAAGILLLPIHGIFYSSEILKLILDNRALVFVDRKLRGLTAPTVSSDNIKAAEEGTEHLLKLGHKNIAFFSGPIKYTSTVEDRYQGFIQGLGRHGINHEASYSCQDFSSVWTWPFFSPDRVAMDFEIAVKHLKKHKGITAAFAIEYSMALIVKAAAESIGLHVPEDLSIITFDSPRVISGTPPITHLLQDECNIGKNAVHTLHKIITNNEALPPSDIMLPAQLVLGASTCQKRGKK